MNEPSKTEAGETPGKNRHRHTLLFIAVVFTAIFVIAFRPAVEAVHCETQTQAGEPDVVMLATAWCPYCYQARKYFIDNEVNYCEYDIENSHRGAQLYAQLNDHAQTTGMQLGIPVLYIGDQLLSGFEPGRVEQALAQLERAKHDNHATTN